VSEPEDPPPLPDAANPFELLGVAAGCDERELKRAYVRMIKVYRPEDRPEEFARIHAAYQLARALRGGGSAGMALPVVAAPTWRSGGAASFAPTPGRDSLGAGARPRDPRGDQVLALAEQGRASLLFAVLEEADLRRAALADDRLLGDVMAALAAISWSRAWIRDDLLDGAAAPYLGAAAGPRAAVLFEEMRGLRHAITRAALYECLPVALEEFLRLARVLPPPRPEQLGQRLAAQIRGRPGAYLHALDFLRVLDAHALVHLEACLNVAGPPPSWLPIRSIADLGEMERILRAERGRFPRDYDYHTLWWSLGVGLSTGLAALLIDPVLLFGTVVITGLTATIHRRRNWRRVARTYARLGRPLAVRLAVEIGISPRELRDWLLANEIRGAYLGHMTDLLPGDVALHLLARCLYTWPAAEPGAAAD